MLGSMRPAARFATIAGAVGSGASQTTPLLLRLILAGWVLFPFVAGVAIDLISKEWAAWVRSTLYGVMLAIAAGSLTIYYLDLRPAGAAAGFLFVAVPAISVGLLVAMLAVAAFVK